jgi:hypothetical protein
MGRILNKSLSMSLPAQICRVGGIFISLMPCRPPEKPATEPSAPHIGAARHWPMIHPVQICNHQPVNFPRHIECITKSDEIQITDPELSLPGIVAIVLIL